jgi:hypothetical protein
MLSRSGVAALLASGVFVVALPARAREIEATDVAETGVHAGLTQVSGGDKNAQLAAFGVSSSHIGFGYERPGTIRVVNNVLLAAGAKGIEGGLSNAVAGGVRAPFGRNHGLVVRGGGEGSFFGNKYLWDSLLELPQLQLGYQWLVPRSVADAALKGGYVLLGRHNTGDGATRNLGASFEWGAIGNLHLRPFDLRTSYTRFYPRYGGSPIDLLEGAFCGIADPLVLCTDFRYERGDVRVPDGTLRDARLSYVGFTIGFVAFESLPVKKKQN